MQKHVFIIHGWGATSSSNWFPRLKKELESRRFLVQVPDMPNTKKPKLNEWVDALGGIVGKPDKNTILVGHSLGVTTILRYLGALPNGEKVGGAVLVAGVVKRVRFELLANFFNDPFDYEKIKKACPKFIAIYSKDDPSVPYERHAPIAEEKLGAKLISLEQGEHLDGDPFFDFSVIRDAVLKIASN